MTPVFTDQCWYQIPNHHHKGFTLWYSIMLGSGEDGKSINGLSERVYNLDFEVDDYENSRALVDTHSNIYEI